MSPGARSVSASSPAHPRSLSPGRNLRPGASLRQAAVFSSLVPPTSPQAPEPRVPAAPPAAPRSAHTPGVTLLQGLLCGRSGNIMSSRRFIVSRLGGDRTRAPCSRRGAVSGLGLSVPAAGTLFPELPGRPEPSPPPAPFCGAPPPMGSRPATPKPSASPLPSSQPALPPGLPRRASGSIILQKAPRSAAFLSRHP